MLAIHCAQVDISYDCFLSRYEMLYVRGNTDSDVPTVHSLIKKINEYETSVTGQFTSKNEVFGE
jgi:hypothetical protein